MTKKEILALYDKAKEYSDKQTENTPDIISRRIFKEALYFAYLAGAGLNIFGPNHG